MSDKPGNDKFSSPPPSLTLDAHSDLTYYPKLVEAMMLRTQVKLLYFILKISGCVFFTGRYYHVSNTRRGRSDMIVKNYQRGSFFVRGEGSD